VFRRAILYVDPPNKLEVNHERCSEVNQRGNLLPGQLPQRSSLERRKCGLVSRRAAAHSISPEGTAMNVRELRKALEGLPDDLELDLSDYGFHPRASADVLQRD
jgi:hypothetical protein